MSACRTDGANATDPTQALQTLTIHSSGVVELVGAAFLAADAELVGEEPSCALTLHRSAAVGRVHGTGHAVSVADEVVGRALLALAGDEAEAGNAHAGICGGGVDGVLAADEDASA